MSGDAPVTEGGPVRDYEVGRGKPPKHTRFQKGRSGNPRGRPKGAVNMTTALEDVLSQTVSVTMDGRQVRMSKLLLMFTQAANKAVKGDLRSMELLCKLAAQTSMGLMNPTGASATTDEQGSHGTAEDEELFAGLLQRVRTEQVP